MKKAATFNQTIPFTFRVSENVKISLVIQKSVFLWLGMTVTLALSRHFHKLFVCSISVRLARKDVEGGSGMSGKLWLPSFPVGTQETLTRTDTEKRSSEGTTPPRDIYLCIEVG